MADRGLFTNLTFRADRWAGGIKQGYMDAFNVTALTITKPDPDVKQRISRMAESYGQALGAVSVPKPEELAFTTDSLPAQYLAMALLGVPAPIAQTAATDAAGTFVAKLDTWIPASHVELTAFAIAGKTADGADPDYIVNLAAGLVKPLSTGTIADGETVNYTLSAPARSGSEIVAGTQSLIQLSLIGSGINADTGKRCGLEIYKANVSPSGGLSFIADDYISVQFKGTLIKPENRLGAWRYWEFD